MKQSNNRRQIKRLAKPGELNAIILPARRALDALRAETGFSSDDAISISIFASLAELIAKRKTRDSDAQAAARLNSSLASLLDEHAIDEHVLDKMESDFFRLTMLVSSVPVKELWAIIHELDQQKL